jgi:hypothetical protein
LLQEQHFFCNNTVGSAAPPAGSLFALLAHCLGFALATIADISSYGEAGNWSTDLVRSPGMAREALAPPRFLDRVSPMLAGAAEISPARHWRYRQ